MATTSTVYVRNLEERIKLPALVDSLREIFSTYGTILDVVARSTLRTKGQAFIIYDTPSAAADAVADAQGFPLYDKPLQLAIARAPSDATLRPHMSAAELEAHRAARKEAQRVRVAREDAERKEEKARHEKLKRQNAGGEDPRAAKAAKTEGRAAQPAIVPDEFLPPNRVVFVRDLPAGYDEDGVRALFGAFEGFSEVRMVPGNKGMAFVEFETEEQSGRAKANTSGIVLGGSDKPIKVTFQRAGPKE